MRPNGHVPEVEVAHFDTVVLAGGHAVRMGGADKPAMQVGGTSMIVWVATAAAAAGTRRLVIVGPERAGAVQARLVAIGSQLPGGLVRVREDPPGGGPVAALRRGVAELTAPWVALLAADLPFLTRAYLTGMLTAGLAAGAAGVVLADDAGRPQWLAGFWQVSALCRELAGYNGSSLRGLLAPLQPVVLRQAVADAGQAPWLDCDTPEDLAAAEAAFRVRTECHDNSR